ncbi:hypothetical protein [Cronobacter sakazakii]|uniref:hypothetical protein n=1 Tax=Cronobacter sakazakii TaxID=28141 RepID=UPI0002D72CF5|nr:hypothetical protein [Cronobacter sakazakii]EGT4355284.1 hypothetical protein [Cronobacter sakazakii]EJH8727461.1 hypothetical protein [Cronobacter sakazakii]EJJ0566164.1 hypothetical protein [Cronobacter sakazakii]EJJ0660014.1 hypothetical protein [Cronobacter sakazakii]EJJ0669114.1 hypothetical protein [Cronobacter sakazakii]
MRKFFKWSILVLTTVVILCWLFIYFIASGINETTTYTEKDFFNYHSLTDKDIAKAPRISKDYYFESHPGDGYAPSNTIIFRGVSDVEPLRAYLTNLGYTRQKGGSREAEIWTKPEQMNSDLFYLRSNADTGEVELTKELNN